MPYCGLKGIWEYFSYSKLLSSLLTINASTFFALYLVKVKALDVGFGEQVNRRTKDLIPINGTSVVLFFTILD